MTQLKALRELSPERRRSVLMNLMGLFLPRPDEDSPKHLPDTGPEAAVLDELLSRAKTDRRELAGSARSKVLESLYTAFLNSELTTQRSEAAKLRLGDSGLLPPQQYRLKFGGTFKLFEEMGARRVHVAETIARADYVQHLVPERLTAESAYAVSLFCKRVQLGRGEPFYNLVVASRDGDAQRIDAVWRLYPSVIQTAPGAALIEWLRAFVTKFGIPIVIGNRAPALFVLYDVIPLGQGPRDQVIAIKPPLEHEVVESFMLRISPLNVAEVTLAYAIDMTLYKMHLRDHGVRTS